jgi:hypothetical protein
MKTSSSVSLSLILVREFGPVAKGSLNEVRKSCSRPNCKACKSGIKHPAWLFTYRKDGKAYSLHVPRDMTETVRLAIENGRQLEQLIVAAGVALIRERKKP